MDIAHISDDDLDAHFDELVLDGRLDCATAERLAAEERARRQQLAEASA